MFKKKHILILLLLIVAIGTISSVSAMDNNTSDEIAIDQDTNVMAIENNDNDIIADDDYVDDYDDEFDDYEDDEDYEDEDDEEYPYDSQITVQESGKYLNDKVFKVTLTDLEGNLLKNNELWYHIESKNGNYWDIGTLKTNTKGVATYKWDYTQLPAGTYDVEFSSFGDADFEEVLLENVKVSKLSVKIKPTKLTTVYNSGKTFNVKVVDSKNRAVSGVVLTLKVYTGKKANTVTVTTNANGIAKYKASTLSKGTHRIIISAKNAKATKKNSKVVIKQRSLTIKAKSFKVNTRDIAGGAITIQVKDKSTKKGLNGVKLTLKIYTGKKYKTVKLVTGYDSDDKKNGIAGILTNQYSVGTHKVKITPTNKNYKGSANAKLVITKSAKKNFYNYHLYFSKGKEYFKVYK
ncbi:hypothetical protein [Methanobrevibacter sp.]|uniref:hypothetical protein n=1 Tax=Methanobrevibacter sp. TaxID=66852 RepID=UPI003862F5AD